ncbi:MAG: helix-turn-helix domain-containing protein [Sphingopyxis sp.]
MEYAPPPPELADRISSLYTLSQSTATYDEVERADRPQLRVMISGSGHYHFPDGHADPAFPVTIIGPSSGTIRGIGHGPMRVVGAGLLPSAWAVLMGADAQHWADRAFDAEQIVGVRARALYDAIHAKDDTARHFALICDFIADIADSTHDAGATAFIRIVDAWLSERIDPEINALVDRTGLGMRQIERLSKRYYGLPPKTLARKYRALRAAAALARGDDLDALGLGETFYDQSHLIREMKRFAGLTPEQIKKRQSSMLTEISKGRKALEGQVGALVSDA